MVMNENIDLKELLKCKPLKLYSGTWTWRSLIFMEYTTSNEKNVSGEQKFSCYNTLTIRVNLLYKARISKLSKHLRSILTRTILFSLIIIFKGWCNNIRVYLFYYQVITFFYMLYLDTTARYACITMYTNATTNSQNKTPLTDAHGSNLFHGRQVLRLLH